VKLLEELKKRKVFRVAAVYAVVAWLLIQVADVVLPALQLPPWTVTFITVLFILGLPIAVILAWAYEVSPEGIRADTGAGAQHSSARSPAAANQGLLYATFALVLLVAGFQFADRFLVAQTGSSVDTAANSSSGMSSTSARPVLRIPVDLPEEEFFHSSRGDFDLAPDGSFFVYRGSDEEGEPLLWLRRWDSLHGRPLAGTSGATRPRISPDGSEVLFPTDGEINELTLGSGQTRTLLESDNLYNLEPNWSADGSSVYFVNADGGISRVPATGGAEEVLVNLNRDNGDEQFEFLEPLPGSALLFTVERVDGVRTIRARDGASGQVKELVEGNYPIYSSSGHLLFQREEAAQLLAAPFDPQALELLGPPLEIDAGLLLEGSGNAANVGVSDTGRLIYRKGGGASGQLATPVWVDRDGSVAEVESGWQMISLTGRGIASLSPGDEAIAVAIATTGSFADIWVNQLDGPMSRITFGDQRLALPSWSADGETVYYMNESPTDNGEIWSRRADGNGPPQLVFEDDVQVRGMDVSNDGRWLVYRDLPSGSASGRLRALDLGAGGEAITLVDADHRSSSPALSPDGRWLAYTSDESGQFEVYVRPFPDVDAGLWQISVNGGTEPRWAHSGEELFYRNGNNAMVAVDVVEGTAFRWQMERVLFDASPFRRTSGEVTSYSVTSDDQRFLMMRRDRVLDTELIMVDNWERLIEEQR